MTSVPDEPTRSRAEPDEPEARRGRCCALRDGLPAGHRHRGRRWPRRARRIAAGTGPVAIDAERASGYRYSTRAYLIQLRREGAGTWLVDPIAFDVPGPAAGGPRAAPSGSCTPRPRTCPACARSGCVPTALFDTELAGRLLGYPRVGLATLVETLLG